MTSNYKEVRGILFKKYRNIVGKYIFVMDENGKKTKIFVGRALFDKAELNSKWTMGHIDGRLINIRPGFCKNEDDWVEEFDQFQYVEQLDILEFLLYSSYSSLSSSFKSSTKACASGFT